MDYAIEAAHDSFGVTFYILVKAGVEVLRSYSFKFVNDSYGNLTGN